MYSSGLFAVSFELGLDIVEENTMVQLMLISETTRNAYN